MAKGVAKIAVSVKYDTKGKKFFLLEKSKGAISSREAYEAMESLGEFGPFLMRFDVPEDVPMEYYDPGDAWMLYDPKDLCEDMWEEAYNRGYDDCIKDHGID